MRLVGPKRRQHLFPFEQPESFLDLSLLAAKHQASEEERGLLAAADRTYWTVDEFRKQGYKLHPDLAVLGDFILAPTQLKKVEEYLLNTVEEFHREQPLAPGPNKETLRASTGLPSVSLTRLSPTIPNYRRGRGPSVQLAIKSAFPLKMGRNWLSWKSW